MELTPFTRPCELGVVVLMFGYGIKGCLVTLEVLSGFITAVPIADFDAVAEVAGVTSAEGVFADGADATFLTGVDVITNFPLADAGANTLSALASKVIEITIEEISACTKMNRKVRFLT